MEFKDRERTEFEEQKRAKEEALFRRIADAYVEEHGRELKRDRDVIESSGQRLSAEQEKRIYRRARKGSGRKPIWAVGLAAACVLILLLIPVRDGVDHSSNESPVPGLLPQPDMIALDAELPQGYYVSSVEQDKEKTIYYLAEDRMDDVVLVAERASGTAEHEELRESQLKGQTVYGLSRTDYNILTFVKEDIRYTLTCRYEMDTLLILGNSLL